MVTWVWIALGAFTLWRAQRYALNRWGEWTLACLLGRWHDHCTQHLTCGCPHHDEYIMEVMSR